MRRRPGPWARTQAAFAAAVVIPLIAGTAARSQNGPFLYVPNAGDNSVSVIDTPTGTAASSPLAVGAGPQVAAVSGDESVVYVTNETADNVSVINTATGAVTATIPVGNDPVGVVLAPNGTRAYVSNFGAGTVSVIDTATNTVTATVRVGVGPALIAVSPDGATAYVANEFSNTVSVIDTATNTVTASIAVGIQPIGVAVSPDGASVYVTNGVSGTVSVINAATDAVTATIRVGSRPIDVAFSPDGTRAYVANQADNRITVIDTSTDSIVARVPVGSSPLGVSVSPNGAFVYVTNQGGDSVSVVSAATDTVVATLNVGSEPVIAGICGNGNALLASGLTFKANTSGALACTLASGSGGSPGPVFTGGTMQFTGANIASALPITLQSQGGTFDTDGNKATLSGAIGGPGALTKIGAGTLTLSGANSYSGGTTLSAGTLTVGNDAALGTGRLTMAPGTTLSFLGSGNFTVANEIAISGDPTVVAPANTTQTLSGAIVDGAAPGSLTLNGGGTLVLTAIDTYTGATSVNAGLLEVNGSIASSSLLTVNGGAVLAGTGAVPTTQINSGATLAPGSGVPGTRLTVAGNLTFQPGAAYSVYLNPFAATNTVVSGTAALAGAVNATFASAGYLSRQYTILTAAAGLGGTTFAGLNNINLPAGASDSLSYDADHVYLNLQAGFAQYPNLTVNQQNVANALINYFNTSGSLPAAFLALDPAGLTQSDGEVAVGAAFAAFQLTDEFLNLMLDPFVYGRRGSPDDQVALGFAPEAQTDFAPEIARAYDGVFKAPPPSSFAQRWTAWGGAYGGAGTTNGNAATGSSTIGVQTFGFAAGMDYHYAPDAVVGFALGGGGVNWGLAGGLGAGRSDAFQAGVYGISHFGPAYLAAALSFTNHAMTTNRSAPGDPLTANFDAQSYGARLETGWRLAVAGLGVAPYGALQAQDFDAPHYGEADPSGGGFGLSYAAANATDLRTELGGRFDRSLVVAGMPLLLRARLAWAHDFVSTPALDAAFESLPGASFVVNGAPIPQNSALTSAGFEILLSPRWTLLAKFDGEFANGSQTYGGSGTLRHTW
jgi:YVTN family beta-propeller protein/autotransporter-associated beta strand protein